MAHKPILRVLIVAFIMLAAVACSSPPQPTPQPVPTTQQQRIENFTLAKLDSYRGKVVVLNFWAIFCAPCRIEMPDLDAIHRQYRDRGVMVLAVNVVDNASDISAFAAKLGLTLPLLQDSQREGMREYGVSALPTTLFIDRQGNIRHRQVGGPMSSSFIKQKIEPLLQ